MRSLSLAIAFALTASLACADETIRCGSWVVTKDITVAELVKKCGTPQSKEIETLESRRATVSGGSMASGTTVTERWTYSRSSRAFPIVVTIVDGEVKRIDRAE